MPQGCVTPNRTRATCARLNLLLPSRATPFPVGPTSRPGTGWIASTAERIDAWHLRHKLREPTNQSASVGGLFIVLGLPGEFGRGLRRVVLLPRRANLPTCATLPPTPSF